MTAFDYALLFSLPFFGVGYFALNVWIMYKLNLWWTSLLDRCRRLIPYLEWELYRRFPNLKIERFNARDRDVERDRLMNETTRLPPDEELFVYAMWGTEVFGPSEIDAFYKNLRRLEWDEGGKFRNEEHAAAKGIAEQRMYGASGAFNLGLVVRKDEKRFLGMDYFAPLPPEVDYLLVELQQVSPSFTCVTIGFVLKEEESKLYAEALSRERRSERRAVPKSRAVTHLRVDSLKRESIEKAREHYRSIVTSWFAEFMPGYFSTAGGGPSLPTGEFVSTHRSKILADRSTSKPLQGGDWTALLTPRRFYRDAWTSGEYAALRAAFDSFEGNSRYHTLFELTAEDLDDESLKYRGERGRGAYVGIVHEQITGILSYYAIYALLVEAAKAVRVSRESLEVGRRGGASKGVLESIRQAFRIFSGLTSAIDDLVEYASEQSHYDHYAEDFTKKGTGKYSEQTYHLKDSLRQRTLQLGQRLAKDEAAARELFDQLASIVSIQESIRSQRRMEILTYIAIFLALASLLVAMPTLDKWAEFLQSFTAHVHRLANEHRW